MHKYSKKEAALVYYYYFCEANGSSSEALCWPRCCERHRRSFKNKTKRRRVERAIMWRSQLQWHTLKKKRETEGSSSIQLFFFSSFFQTITHIAFAFALVAVVCVLKQFTILDDDDDGVRWSCPGG